MSEIRHTYEADHHPEVVENAKAVRSLELLGIKDKLADPASRRSFFQELDDETFKKFLGYVNSVTRRQPTSYEYEDGQLPMEHTPPFEDKEMLMKATFATIREILSDEETEAAESLELAGLTLAGAVNYIHPYKNGNGRVGRVAHYLVTYGAERGDEAMEAELYGAIAKLPPYTFDERRSIIDTPPPELRGELLSQMPPSPLHQSDTDPRKRSSEMVLFYLQVMKGEVEGNNQSEVIYSHKIEPGRYEIEKIAPDQISLIAMYRKKYLDNSFVPNNIPSDLPADAKRIFGEPKQSSGQISM